MVILQLSIHNPTRNTQNSKRPLFSLCMLRTNVPFFSSFGFCRPPSSVICHRSSEALISVALRLCSSVLCPLFSVVLTSEALTSLFFVVLISEAPLSVFSVALTSVLCHRSSGALISVALTSLFLVVLTSEAPPSVFSVALTSVALTSSPFKLTP